MKISIRFTMALFLLSFQLLAFAGAQEGPYVIWVNLSNNKEIDNLITGRIRDEVAGRVTDENRCLSLTSIFFIKTRPSGISDELVRRAIINGNKSAIKTLNGLMRRPFSKNIDEGFDGIMVYDENAGPRLSRMVTGRLSITRKKMPKAKDFDLFWDEFCELVPPITRPI